MHKPSLRREFARFSASRPFDGGWEGKTSKERWGERRCAVTIYPRSILKYGSLAGKNKRRTARGEPLGSGLFASADARSTRLETYDSSGERARGRRWMHRCDRADIYLPPSYLKIHERLIFHEYLSATGREKKSEKKAAESKGIDRNPFRLDCE